MVRFFTAWLTAACFLLFSACRTGADGPGFRGAAREGILLLEAENFRLVESDVIEESAASGGKAVAIRSSRAWCSIDMELPPGAYRARVRARAQDTEHDDFFLSVGKFSVRCAPGEYGRFTFCPQILEFTLGPPGQGFLQFAAFSPEVKAGETGVVIDLVEVWEKAKWDAQAR